MCQIYPSSIPHSNDQKWDAFIASFHRVWEYAPDFSLEHHVRLIDRSVLVVGDNLERNRRFARALDRVGLQLHVALDIVHATNLLAEAVFDMVVLIPIDERSTLNELCRYVSDLPSTHRTGIIVIEDSQNSTDLWAWRKAGAKYCLHEPIDPYVLLTIMSAVVAENREAAFR